MSDLHQRVTVFLNQSEKRTWKIFLVSQYKGAERQNKKPNVTQKSVLCIQKLIKKTP